MYDFDAVVVGGGVYGAAILHGLSRKGITRTLLIDSGRLASGSTANSAAMVRVYHRDSYLTDLAHESFSAFRDYETDVGSPCGFVKTGSLYFESMERLAQVHRDVERLRERNYRIQIVGPWEGATLAPGIRWPQRSFAVWEPDAGYADPLATTVGWIHRARGLGARVFENCRVDRVLVERDRVLGVRTDAGDIRTRRVILASGLGTPQLLGKLGIDTSLSGRWIQFHRFQGEGELTYPAFFNGLDGSFGRPTGRHGALIGVSTSDGQTGAELNRHQMLRSQWVAGNRVRGLERGTLAGAVRAQDVYAPGRRCVLGAVGRYRGLFLATGGSGTGFKNAPAVGARVSNAVVRGG